MIKYKIVSRESGNPSPDRRRKVTPKDPDFKEVVIERHLRNLPFNIGDSATIRGTSKRVTIQSYIRDYSKIIWHHNKPKFIVVTMDETGKEYVVSADQLKPFIRWRRFKK